MKKFFKTTSPTKNDTDSRFFHELIAEKQKSGFIDEMYIQCQINIKNT